jgi:hypothetical protein
MATAKLPGLIKISPASQEALRQYLLQCKTLYYRNWNIRDTMRKADIAYAREADYTDEQLKAKRALVAGDANKYQNITVPVVLPQAEIAVTYQTSVFLTGTPIFGVDSDPVHENEAKQLETIIDRQAIKGGWARHLMMSFRDAEKYNFGICEVDWARTVYAQVQTDISAGANSAKASKVSWEGNVVRRTDPYNTFWDTRYYVTEVSEKGEFFGYSELMSRIELKKFIQETPEFIVANIKDALEAPLPAINIGGDSALLSYYIPQIAQNRIVVPNSIYGFNWMAWAGLETSSTSIRYQNIYEKCVMYARIIPSDFGFTVPSPNTPQLWKFIWVNSQVLVYAQPVSWAFDAIPMLAMSPNEDGLKYQTKSPAANGVDFQNLSSALMNSVVASRRRAISDRTLYDPSRISANQINSDNPSAKIPIRPAAYGKPVGESVFPFPYRDDQSPQMLSEIGGILNMANNLAGTNQAKQGQFVKGNKTRSEYENVMENANGRDQMKSILYECQFFTPLKEMLKLNILEKQTPATMYSRELKQAVAIDPIALRKAALDFRMSDGLVPATKLIGADASAQAMQVIGQNPQIGAQYNAGPLFSYLMKVQGAEISEFEKSPQQIAYEQAMGQWQQIATQIGETAAKSGTDMSKVKYPDQPVPAQYGYVPGAPNTSNSNTQKTQSVLAQWQGKETATDPTIQQAPQSGVPTNGQTST